MKPCFNSKDGAIDRTERKMREMSMIMVSIPKMVRLIVKQSALSAAKLPCFNSKDGAIDSNEAQVRCRICKPVSIPKMVRLIERCRADQQPYQRVSIPKMVRLIDNTDAGVNKNNEFQFQRWCD